METPGGEGSAGLRMQQGNLLKSLSRTFKPAGKSDTQKPTAALKATKPDATKPAMVSKQGKPPEKVIKL